MWTLGIDVAKRKHTATLLDDQGKKVFRNFTFAHSHEGFAMLLARIDQVGIAPRGLLVGMEATGHYWMVLYQSFAEAGFQVRVINPIVTAARRNVGIRGTKTDAADSELIARVLAEANLKYSAVPGEQNRQLRDLMRLRYECTQGLVAEKQRLGALLDLVFPEYADHFSDIFGAASREILSRFPSAQALAKVDIRTLTRILAKASKGRMGKQKAQELKASAKSSFALNGSLDTLTMEIRFVAQRINLLIEQIEQIDHQPIAYMAKEQELLRSIPGIGEVWAPTILGEVLPVFDPENKNGARKFVATAGLDVRLNDSGESKGRGKMSKRGSKYLRTAAMQAANVAVFKSNDPMFKAIYDRQRERGKLHQVALSHVANKLLHVVFSVLKNRKPYKPILAT
jgi:transposase